MLHDSKNAPTPITKYALFHDGEKCYKLVESMWDELPEGKKK